MRTRIINRLPIWALCGLIMTGCGYSGKLGENDDREPIGDVVDLNNGNSQPDDDADRTVPSDDAVLSDGSVDPTDQQNEQADAPVDPMPGDNDVPIGGDVEDDQEDPGLDDTETGEPIEPVEAPTSTPETTDPTPQPVPTPADEIVYAIDDFVGLWQYQSGTRLEELDDLGVRFLEIDGSSVATTFSEDPQTLMRFCHSHQMTIDGDEVSLIREEYLRFYEPEDSRVYQVSFDGPDQITFAYDGGQSTWTRVLDVLVPFRCNNVVMEDRWDIGIQPDSRAELAFDGTKLWVSLEGSGRIFPVDPISGDVGTNLEFPSSRDVVHSADGEMFWSVPNSGNITHGRLLTRDGEVLNDVRTDYYDFTPYSLFSINSLSFNPADGLLYLAGRNYTLERSELRVIDPGVEPSFEVLRTPFLPVDSLTINGTTLWTLRGRHIHEIDISTTQAVRSYVIPDYVTWWRGLEVVGSSLYLIGIDENTNRGVVLKATPDQS